VLPWKCHNAHVMELCDECNNRTKVRFNTEKVVRDIQFLFVISHPCPCWDVTGGLVCMGRILNSSAAGSAVAKKMDTILHHLE